MTQRPALDPAVVAGLIEEYGDEARSGTYERRWERDAATWRAVVQALNEAAGGRRPRAHGDRPPRWLEPLVRSRLETMATRWSHDSAFNVIRTLEHLGLVTFEPDDAYVLAAVGGIGDRFAHSRAESLRADPELVDKVVWRMFEVEGGGEVSLANVDKYSADDVGWQATFIELTSDGTLPRERVLTSALGALNRDFSAYRAGWYSRFYDALAPSVEELNRHQESLRTLLRSTIPATVSFAFAKLRVLSKHGAIDGPETVQALQPAAVAGPKTTAISAIRLVDEIVTRHPELGLDGARIASAALEHPHADVQKAAGAVLRKLGADRLLRDAADLLEPSVQADLLGQRPAADDHPATAAPNPHVVTVMPVSRDDLVDRVAALLEDASNPIQVELVLAGLAALDNPDPLRRLAKRATTILRRGPREGVTSLWLRGQLARLVLIAAGTEIPPTPTTSDPAMSFLLRRIAMVGDVLGQRRRPRTLLATPDHPQGWITPEALVQRLQQRPNPPDEHDLIAALLRTHPEGRPDALRQAQSEIGSLTGPVAEVVRYALGAPRLTTERRRMRRRRQLDDIPLWIAASRSRNPTAHDEWLASHGVHGAGRSDGIAATVVFESKPYTWTERGRVHESVYWTWAVEVADPTARSEDRVPTGVTGARHEPLGGLDHEDLVGWIAVIWPHDCDHFLVATIDAVLRAAAHSEVSHDAVRVLNAVAAHPGRIGSLATTCLAAGLTASKADQRTMAVDAVLQMSQTGRLTTDGLAAGLVSVRGPATLTRLAATMRDIASAGRQQRNLVIDSLGTALPSFDIDARGMHALLELLREELLREGRPPPRALATWLTQLEGTSRASKAAKALLKTT